MQIILSQEEIEQSIDAFVRSQINIADDQTVSIDLKAGRGETGFTSTLDIRAAEPEAPAKPAKKATRAASKPTEPVTPAEPEAEPVAEVAEPEADPVADAIPDTPEESPAAAEAEAEAAGASAEPKKSSIFQFGNKAVGA